MFSQKIIHWYHLNKRDLPWRNTKDPYLIWLSEIILQQTRVDQGLNYYLRFVKEFPNVHKLARASEEKILKLWQGLGYYSRARNLHASAKIIAAKSGAKFPDNYQDLLKLKGVGEYTAAAIASFAYNKAYAVVDGNVYRVLSRVFGVKTPVDSTKGKKEFYELANALIDKKNPGNYNQAIMEFGAMYCKPQNPDCLNCCLNTSCLAFEKKMVDKLPVKSKNTKQRNRYFNYLVVNYKNSLILEKRTDNDIWKNLYDFPLIETNKLLSEAEFVNSPYFKKIITKHKGIIKSVSKVYKHVLSHQKIYARFLEIKAKKSFLSKNSIEVPYKKVNKYAIPRLIENYLQERR